MDVFIHLYSSFVYLFIHPLVYSFLLPFIQNQTPILNPSSFVWLSEALLQFPSPVWYLNNTPILSASWQVPHLNMSGSTEQQTNRQRELRAWTLIHCSISCCHFSHPIVTPIFTMCNIMVCKCTSFLDHLKQAGASWRIPTATWHSSL